MIQHRLTTISYINKSREGITSPQMTHINKEIKAREMNADHHLKIPAWEYDRRKTINCEFEKFKKKSVSPSMV